jgi:hypothetical protein
VRVSGRIRKLAKRHDLAQSILVTLLAVVSWILIMLMAWAIFATS